jgi:hypothetical protein
MNSKSGYYMRLVHRYLGFFLAGIMAMYALSGTLLIFRNTDFLKKEVVIEKKIEQNLTAETLGPALKIKNLKVDKIEGSTLSFKDGMYNSETGEASYTVKQLPTILDKMTHLHKATTNDPLYFLNIFFGMSLLFFVISSFWMFMPSTPIFKKGLLFTAGGILLTLLMLFL